MKEWLRVERNIVTDYVYEGIGNRARGLRASWAQRRAKRIAAELRRRSSRHPKS